MGGCCNKRDDAKSLTGGQQSKQLPAGGISSLEIPKVIEYITRYFTHQPTSEMIVLNFHKDQLKNFINQLSRVMNAIKEKTQKIMVPVSLQQSPMNPDTEVMVLMRTPISEIQDIYFLGHQVSNNVDLLSKKFILRAFQFAVKDQNQRVDHFNNDIMNLYKSENLLLIGGIQDKGKANNMQLLFYKQEKPTVNPNESSNNAYSLEISTHEGHQNQSYIETFINEQQMISNKVLRTLLHFEDDRKTFFIVMQTLGGDKLYMVSQFAEYIKELQTDINANKVMTPGFDEFTAKEDLLMKISENINQQEQVFKNQVQQIMVNTDLSDSMIITVKR